MTLLRHCPVLGLTYIFYFCELMKKFAEKLGLDKDIEERFAGQTVYGSGRMLDVTKEFAATLKESEISKWND
ncbi:hypothetical protein ATZ36_17300 [Candidatus Endomicrobiellum trichonymphae]|uniref:Pyrroline-5-carboxylate reductase dimerisation domain-containing protein n=1 Tax=Endomicrobium trichonymphae TaxID=1408204 RepID=A0A1E5IJQ5_ENDTX|nr:hypothetical protein ATZ36_17300 [Candidatus Endomicrobium trichonymphae]